MFNENQLNELKWLIASLNNLILKSNIKGEHVEEAAILLRLCEKYHGLIESKGDVSTKPSPEEDYGSL